MASSSSRRRRRSRASKSSTASDSDTDPVPVVPSDLQKHSDQVSVVEQAENMHSDSQSGIHLDYLAQDVGYLQPLESTAPADRRSEDVKGDTVSVEATSASDQQHQKVGQSSENRDPSPNTEDRVHRVRIESDRTGWGRLSDRIRQYDRDRVEDVKEDIDTLLVFAGLFSAVITAFIIESYKTLQPQPEDTTNQILLRVSAQLDSLSVSGNFVNSTIPAITSLPFVLARFVVFINILWLLSLVFALITASIGILIKQWLHELMARDTQDPRQQVKIRFFREVGVQKWGIFEIAAALPLLLQLALLLFFVGLSAFFYDLNKAVTWIMMIFMIIWFLFYLFTTFSPLLSSQCPYKTPMLKGILQQVRIGNYTWLNWLGCALYYHIPSTWPKIEQRCKALRDSLNTLSATWLAREEMKVRESDTWDLAVVVCSREILRGEQLEETFADCIRSCDMMTVLSCMKSLSNGRSPDIEMVLPDVPQGFTQSVFQLYISLMGTLVSPSDDLWDLSAWYATSIYAILQLPQFIPRELRPMFIQFINGNEKSAVFSILMMYSFVHKTMRDYPERNAILFPNFSPYDLQKNHSGPQFISNLAAATRSICCYLQPRMDPDTDREEIFLAIKELCSCPDPAIPNNPLAFALTFAEVLFKLTPPITRQEHREILVGVMSEIAVTITDTDGSLWPKSYQSCVEYAYGTFHYVGLADAQLVPKLKELIRTWDP
ncbi:hypothetical protein QCA50_019571 [Cerrena zonata]|uniref:DUF6535 domain-containing protein n=1 Tax=Cerrena zonata TaxID=2478898 RepID=A0AAW0FAE3_9APHY